MTHEAMIAGELQLEGHYTKQTLERVQEALDRTELNGTASMVMDELLNPVIVFDFDGESTHYMNAINFVFAIKIAYIANLAKELDFTVSGDVTIYSRMGGGRVMALAVTVNDGVAKADRGETDWARPEFGIKWKGTPVVVELDLDRLNF